MSNLVNRGVWILNRMAQILIVFCVKYIWQRTTNILYKGQYVTHRWKKVKCS
jgi:hypothetical protein